MSKKEICAVPIVSIVEENGCAQYPMPSIYFISSNKKTALNLYPRDLYIPPGMLRCMCANTLPLYHVHSTITTTLPGAYSHKYNTKRLI